MSAKRIPNPTMSSDVAMQADDDVITHEDRLSVIPSCQWPIARRRSRIPPWRMPLAYWLASTLAPHFALRIPHSKRRRGFTVIELLVIIACIAVLAGLVFPGMGRARAKSKRIGCVGNLKQMGLAFRIFAVDNADRFPMQVLTNRDGTLAFSKPGQMFKYFQVMSNELSTPVILNCHSDTRKRATNWFTLTDSNISYFIGCDTTETLPQALLAGDRNLEANGRPVPPGLFLLTTNLTMGWTRAMHDRSGNIALGDGSVQQSTASRLNEQIAGQGVATNRLLVP